MVENDTFIRDILFFIKNDLLTNITDPLGATRPGNSKFVMTSYPQREAVYPMITLKITNAKAKRAGMQTTKMDVRLELEARIWARNEKERDTIFTSVFNRLRSIQFTTTGTTESNMHDFAMPSALEVNEEGDAGIKSKIMNINYSFFNL